MITFALLQIFPRILNITASYPNSEWITVAGNVKFRQVQRAFVCRGGKARRHIQVFLVTRFQGPELIWDTRSMGVIISAAVLKTSMAQASP